MGWLVYVRRLLRVRVYGKRSLGHGSMISSEVPLHSSDAPKSAHRLNIKNSKLFSRNGNDNEIHL